MYKKEGKVCEEVEVHFLGTRGLAEHRHFTRRDKGRRYGLGAILHHHALGSWMSVAERKHLARVISFFEVHDRDHLYKVEGRHARNLGIGIGSRNAIDVVEHQIALCPIVEPKLLWFFV